MTGIYYLVTYRRSLPNCIRPDQIEKLEFPVMCFADELQERWAQVDMDLCQSMILLSMLVVFNSDYTIRT